MRKTCYPVLAAALIAILPIASAQAGNPGKGERIYMANCANCHGTDGMALLPNTPHFKRNERLDKPDGVLLKSIRGGKNLMPAWQGVLRETDMLDVVAYVRTLAR